MQSSRHILLVPAWLAVLGAQLNYPVSFRPDRAALVLAKSFLLPLALGMVVRRLFPAIAEQVGSRQVSERAYRAPALQRVNRISVPRKRVGAVADLTRLPGTDRRCGRDLSPAMPNWTAGPGAMRNISAAARSPERHSRESSPPLSDHRSTKPSRRPSPSEMPER
jgi:hypothetical protein